MSSLFSTFPEYLKDLFLKDQKSITTTMIVEGDKVMDGINVNYSIDSEKLLLLKPIKIGSDNVIQEFEYTHEVDNVSKKYIIKDFDDLIFLIFEIGKDQLSKDGIIFNSENDFREVFVKEFTKRKWLKKEYHFRTNDKIFFADLLNKQKSEEIEMDNKKEPVKEITSKDFELKKSDSDEEPEF